MYGVYKQPTWYGISGRRVCREEELTACLEQMDYILTIWVATLSRWIDILTTRNINCIVVLVNTEKAACVFPLGCTRYRL